MKRGIKSMAKLVKKSEKPSSIREVIQKAKAAAKEEPKKVETPVEEAPKKRGRPPKAAPAEQVKKEEKQTKAPKPPVAEEEEEQEEQEEQEIYPEIVPGKNFDYHRNSEKAEDLALRLYNALTLHIIVHEKDGEKPTDYAVVHITKKFVHMIDLGKTDSDPDNAYVTLTHEEFNNRVSNDLQFGVYDRVAKEVKAKEKVKEEPKKEEPKEEKPARRSGLRKS
jgi:hypothetical protein